MCRRCIELEEEVAWLKGELGMLVSASEVEIVKQAFGLTPMCARIVLALYHAKGRVLSTEHLDSILPRHQRSEELAESYIKSQVCIIRRKVGSDFIHTAWALGFSLPPASQAKIAKLLAPNQIEKAA